MSGAVAADTAVLVLGSEGAQDRFTLSRADSSTTIGTGRISTETASLLSRYSTTVTSFESQ